MYREIINFKDHIKQIYIDGSTNSYHWGLRDLYYTITLNNSIKQNITILRSDTPRCVYQNYSRSLMEGIAVNNTTIFVIYTITYQLHVSAIS
jgi:hypothetical protein